MSNVRKTKSQQTINTDHNRQLKNKKFASTANIYSASPFPISIQANIIVNENSSLSKSSIRGRKHLGESERKKIVRWSSVPTVLNAEKTVSVAKDRKNDAEELKIFKNFDVNADDVAVELRLEKELPKYGYLANLLKRNGTLFLRSNLEESFSKFFENDEKKVGINTSLSHFFKECAKSTKNYLESCKFSSQNDAISAPQNSNESEKLKNSFLTWWKMNCAYLNFQRQREIDIEKMLEEFKNLEEQNIILKDVLTHVQKQNGSRYSFKINVVKEEFEFGKRNKEMCDKEVSTTNLDCDDDSGSQPQNVVEVPSSHEIYPRDQEINFPNSTPTIFSTDSSLDSIRAEEPATEILQDKDYNSEVNFSEQQADSNDQSLNTVENRTLDSVDRSRGGLDINETSQSVSASVNIEPKLNDDDNAGTEKVQNIAQASNFLQVRNIETDEKLCGEDTPIPIFHSVGVEADFPHPSEAELELCKSKLEQRELELLKLQQATQLLKSEHLIEINNLKQPYESEIEKIKHKFDTLQNQNKDLETTCVELNAEASRWERKAIEAERREAIGNEKIAKWEKEIEVKKKELQSVQEECAKLKENFSMLTDSNLALKTSFESTCTQLSETNQTLETTAEELNDIRLSLESAKFELEKSKKSETEAKTKCGEYHHTVLKRNEELQEMHVKLKGLESSERVHSIKVKELETIINNLMKFPDMSLGDDFTPTGQISLSQFDAMLSEMISSNNLRISLLEQKNNELRMQRIKLANQTVDLQNNTITTTVFTQNQYSTPASDKISALKQQKYQPTYENPTRLWESSRTIRAENVISKPTPIYVNTPTPIPTSSSTVHHHHHHHHHHHIQKKSVKIYENEIQTPSNITKHPPAEILEFNPVAMIRITAFVAFALFIASINAIPLFPRGLDISANPFDGAIWHIDLEWTQKVKSATYTNSVIEGKANTVMKQSTAIWIDKIANLPRVTLNMQNARNRANAMGKPVVVQFVVYDLPGRDCHALSSNGELSAGQDAEYQGYINDFAQRLKDNAADNVRVVLIIEPDSLPNIATNLANPKCKAAESSYRKGVAYALAKLSLPNVWMYIDVAHGGWLGWESGQTAAIPVFKSVISDAMAIQPSLRIAGWATNTANYSPLNYNGVAPAKQHILELKNGRLVYDFNPCIDELTFIGDLKKNFSVNNLPTRFIIDTSRNGVPGIRTDWGNWCNVKGSGIGSLPTVNPVANVDAFVWVKPPGESDGQSSGGDGYCDPTNTQHGMDALANAPRAGEWFQDMFVQLIQNANPPLVDSGLIKINWKPDLWAFACDWTGGDLSNARTSGADCGPLCGRTSGCTHFTWNSYNGGTCWMKTGSVLPEDAKSTGDQSMVCGYTNTINWNGDWAFGCDWKGDDLSNKLSSGDLCGGICNNTPDCTHFTWSAYNGGTCWLKKNYSITKANAFRTTDGTVVCGINSLRVNQEAKTQKRKQVAAQFVPQFRFHPNEDIWPTNLDEFMSHAVSVVTISSDSTKLNIIQSNPQPATLNPLLGITETAEVNFSDNYSDVTVNYFTSWVHTKLSTDLWKVYTIIYDKDFDEKDAAVDWYEIQYWLLYPYNSVPGGPNDSDWSLLKPIAGTYDHIADLECVTLRFDKKTNLPTRIWLSQHGNGPVYKWDTPSNNGYVPFAKDGAGHPIVYVSQGTHSHRGFVGDFNFKVIKYWDHTSDSGLHWTPSASNLDITFVNEPFDKIDRTKFYQANDRNRWLVFNGDFGYIKITSSIFTSAKFSRVSHVTSIFQQGGQGSFTEKLNDEETHCDNDWDHSFFHSAGACSMPV